MKIKMRQMVIGAALMGAAATASGVAASAIDGDTGVTTDSTVPTSDPGVDTTVPTGDTGVDTTVPSTDSGTGSTDSGTTGTTDSGTTSGATTTPACPAPGMRPDGHRGRGGNGGPGAELTGDTATKVKAAAAAAVPGGAVDRVEEDKSGTAPYHAHVTKADGTRVKVYVNADFTVKSIADDLGPQGRGGKDGKGGPGAELTGDTATKVKAAAAAAVPGGTVDRVEEDKSGTAPYHAHVTKADGTRVKVYVNADFTVKSIADDLGPQGRGGKDGKDGKDGPCGPMHSSTGNTGTGNTSTGGGITFPSAATNSI